jgi:hypothetical protein
MTRSRSAHVARYLATEGGFPFAAYCRPEEIGWSEGWGGILLPRPFEGMLVTGHAGLRANHREWMLDEQARGFRVVASTPPKRRDPDNMVVMLRGRAFTELSRHYWMEGGRS